MSDVKELVIIGAGPAGISAAIQAANLGVEVILIDSAPMPGGQYFKQTQLNINHKPHDAQQIKANKLFKQLKASNVTFYGGTLVWGIFESPIPNAWHLTLHGPNAPARMDARNIILATGAYDKSIPFPGWDLPGVITAGAALTMVKNQRILPGKRILLAGSGPLQMAAAAHLCENGAEVVSVLENAPNLFWRGIPYLPAVWGQWARIKEGFGYLKTLIAARVPYKIGWTIVSAKGEERVQEVTIAKLDRQGSPIPGSRQTLAVDTVVVGNGLTPGTELSRQLNCEFEYLIGQGGFVPIRTALLEISLAGIFAVGDCASIGGAELSMIEGRIAATAVAHKLNHISEEDLLQHIAQENKALHREQKFAKLLGDLFSPSESLYQRAAEDTIICRCEQITLAEIRTAISYGAQTVADVKNISRSGMGNCQGRTCESIVAAILAKETGKTVEQVKYNNIRPPVHPLPLGVIEGYQIDSTGFLNREGVNHD